MNQFSFPLSELPKDIIRMVLNNITDPKTFFNVLQTCREVYSLCNPLTRINDFLRVIVGVYPTQEETYDQVYWFSYKIMYTITPNGRKEGVYKVFRKENTSTDDKYSVVTEIYYKQDVEIRVVKEKTWWELDMV